MKRLDKDNYESVTGSGSRIVVFTGPSCARCHALITELEETGLGEGIFYVDTGADRRLAVKNHVMGLPSVLLYKDGKEMARMSGRVDVEDIMELFEVLESKI